LLASREQLKSGADSASPPGAIGTESWEPQGQEPVFPQLQEPQVSVPDLLDLVWPRREHLQELQEGSPALEQEQERAQRPWLVPGASAFPWTSSYLRRATIW
jgi:hypothetical protein